LEVSSRTATLPTKNSSRFYLAYFAEGKSVTSAAQHGNLAKDTVRRFYNKIHQRIAEDLITQTKIGGPVTVVEIDESKFGKQSSGRRGTA